MEQKDFWKQKLTPYDAELFLMVESLTGKKCEPKNGGNERYFIVVDYSNNPEPVFIAAVMDAVAGRVGERLVEISDKPDAQNFVAHIKFSKTEYPGIIRLPRGYDKQLGLGNIYCQRTSNIRALQVNRNNAERLLRFVGNGEWEIDKQPGGKAVFHFLNAGGSVYAHAPENSYIVYVGPERFEIIDKEMFEKEYELR